MGEVEEMRARFQNRRRSATPVILSLCLCIVATGTVWATAKESVYAKGPEIVSPKLHLKKKHANRKEFEDEQLRRGAAPRVRVNKKLIKGLQPVDETVDFLDMNGRKSKSIPLNVVDREGQMLEAYHYVHIWPDSKKTRVEVYSEVDAEFLRELNVAPFRRFYDIDGNLTAEFSGRYRVMPVGDDAHFIELMEAVPERGWVSLLDIDGKTLWKKDIFPEMEHRTMNLAVAWLPKSKRFFIAQTGAGLKGHSLLDLAGNIIWKIIGDQAIGGLDFPSSAYQSPAPSPDETWIFVGHAGAAINLVDGQVRWKIAGPVGHMEWAVSADGKILFLLHSPGGRSDKAWLQALDTTNGKELWSHEFPVSAGPRSIKARKGQVLVSIGSWPRRGRWYCLMDNMGKVLVNWEAVPEKEYPANMMGPADWSMDFDGDDIEIIKDGVPEVYELEQ